MRASMFRCEERVAFIPGLLVKKKSVCGGVGGGGGGGGEEERDGKYDDEDEDGDAMMIRIIVNITSCITKTKCYPEFGV